MVKLIFSKYLEAWGQDKIARFLSKQGYKTPSQLSGKKDAGRHWHGSTVFNILSNPIYCGHLVQHRETTYDVVNKKRKQVPQKEQIWAMNVVPPIVDEVTFNLVQQKIENKKRNGKFKRHLENRHLFTGFLYCADCGAPLWYRSNRQGYICGKYAKHGKIACTHHAIREEHLITLVRKDLRKFFTVDIETLNIEDKVNAMSKNVEVEVKRLESTIENLQLKNKGYIDRLLDGLMTEDECKNYTSVNTEEIQSLQLELEKMVSQRVNKKPDISAVRSKLVKITNLEVIDRELLNMLIDRIEVKETGELKVFYTFASPVQEYNYKRLKSS